MSYKGWIAPWKAPIQMPSDYCCCPHSWLMRIGRGCELEYELELAAAWTDADVLLSIVLLLSWCSGSFAFCRFAVWCPGSCRRGSTSEVRSRICNAESTIRSMHRFHPFNSNISLLKSVKNWYSPPWIEMTLIIEHSYTPIIIFKAYVPTGSWFQPVVCSFGPLMMW